MWMNDIEEKMVLARPRFPDSFLQPTLGQAAKIVKKR